MKRKYKMTGCAKFIIFLLIAAPAAFFISAYYNGEDGIAMLKDKLGLDKIISSNEASSPSASDENIYELEKTIEDLKSQIEELEENIEQKDLEIKHLKDQLESTDS